MNIPTPSIAWHDRRRLKPLWSEDDARPIDRERIGDAWHRLFGERLPSQQEAVATEDLGDCFLYLHKEGRVAEYSCMGEAIYQVDPDEGSGHIVVLNGGSPAEIHPEKHEPDRGLSDDQRIALDALFSAIARGERVLVLTGAAGTGKTYLMGVFAREAKALGWDLIYLAPTGKAALRLSQSVKTQAFTVHSRLYASVSENEEGDPVFADPQPITMGRTIAICDEASMISEYLHHDLIRTLPEGCVLLYVGDREQIEPVVGTWGPDFDHPTAVLEQVHRQALDSPIIQVATILRTGGRLPEENIGEAYKRPKGTLKVAAQWLCRELGHGEDAIVLSWTNDARHRVNKLVRHQLGYGDDPLVPEEQIVILLNNKVLQRNNGETLRVEAVAPFGHHGILKVKASDGRILFVHPDLIGADLTDFKAWCKKHQSSFDLRVMAHIDYGYGLTIHKCVHPDTLVETDSGIQPIRTIPPTGRIATPGGMKAYKNKVSNPSMDALKIETENGYTVTVTSEHGLDSWRDGYTRIKAGQLQEGDWLRLKLGPTGPRSSPVLLPHVSEIDSREHQVILPDLLTPDVAELLGLLVADGVLLRGGVRLVKRYKSTVERFRELCRNIFGKDPVPCEVHGTSGLELDSTRVRRWLAEIGGVSPWSKKVPDCVLGAPEVLQAAFLRGLFEDGSVHEKDGYLDHIELRQDNESLIRTVRLLLLRQGIVASKVRGKIKIPNLQIYGFHARVFAEKISFVSLEKRDRAKATPRTEDTRNRIPIDQKQLLQLHQMATDGKSEITMFDLRNARNRGYVSRAKATKMPFMAEALTWQHERIRTITETSCPSVCVEVPDGHQFLQNGFSGWNSQGSEYDKVLVVLDGKTKWVARKSIENAQRLRRLLYTAATRAKKQLIILDVA